MAYHLYGNAIEIIEVLMSFLTANAYADVAASTATSTAGLPANADLMGTVLPFVVIFVVFYFLILRPQQKKFKLHQAMVAGIKKGDEVITSGGILGKVKNVDDRGFVQVEIASGVVVKVLGSTISNITSDTPVNDNTVAKKKS